MVTAYGTTYNHDISINYPATATAYEPYQGSTTPISWADEAGTVYGGTLTWEKDGTVTLVVDRATTEFVGDGSEGFVAEYVTAYDGYRIAKRGLPIKDISGTTKADVLSDTFASDLANRPWTVKHYMTRVWFYLPKDMTTVEQFNDWLASNHTTIVYELDTPVTYTLTPQEALVFLRGTNNVWNDINDTTVTYWTHKTGDSV